jgi:pectate lyase
MLFLLLIAAVYSLSYDVNNIIGFGAKTTGGSGGSVIKVTTRDALDAALKASGKAIIIVTSSITFADGGRIDGVGWSEISDK